MKNILPRTRTIKSRPCTKKENNPFSEEEKHGDPAQRRAPGIEQEYQGGPPDSRRAPGVEEDTDTEEDERKRA